MLKEMIVKLISILEAKQLTVTAVVCDQEAAHSSCLNSMGVTQTSPHFFSEAGNKVYAMHDIPHLIKKRTSETTCGRKILLLMVR